MDKIKFLKEEVELVLDSFEGLNKDKKEELMIQTENMTEENLLELLKNLYRIRRDFIQAEYDIVNAKDGYLTNLNTSNE